MENSCENSIEEMMLRQSEEIQERAKICGISCGSLVQKWGIWGEVKSIGSLGVFVKWEKPMEGRMYGDYSPEQLEVLC